MYADEPVKLSLLKSFYLPLLTYCPGALELSEVIHQLSVCMRFTTVGRSL